MSSTVWSIERDEAVSISEYRDELKRLARYIPGFDPMRPLKGRDVQSAMIDAVATLDRAKGSKVLDRVLKKSSAARAMGISESTWRKVRNGKRGVTTLTFATMVSELARTAEDDKDAGASGAYNSRRVVASSFIGIDEEHGKPLTVTIESPALKKLFRLASDMDEESISVLATIAEWHAEKR